MTPPRGHAEPRELVAYHAGQMAEADAESLRDHLALCSECSELLLDLIHFEELEMPEGVAEPSEVEVARALESLKGRLLAPPPLPGRPQIESAPPRYAWRRLLPLTLAAGLAGVVVGWSLRPVPGETEILSGVETVDIISDSSPVRGKENVKRRISFLPVPLPPSMEYDSYAAEVSPYPSGDVSLRFDKLLPNNERQLVLAFGRDFPGGKYRVTVFGLRNERRIPLRLSPEVIHLEP